MIKCKLDIRGYSRIFLEYIFIAVGIIFITNVILMTILHLGIESSDMYDLENNYSKIFQDIDKEALVTIPIEYTEEYVNKLIKKGNYSPKNSEYVKIKRKELYKYDAEFKVINGQAYISEEGFILSAILDEEYKGSVKQLLDGVDRYKKESTYITINKLADVSIKWTFISFILVMIILELQSRI